MALYGIIRYIYGVIRYYKYELRCEGLDIKNFFTIASCLYFCYTIDLPFYYSKRHLIQKDSKIFIV